MNSPTRRQLILGAAFVFAMLMLAGVIAMGFYGAMQSTGNPPAN